MHLQRPNWDGQRRQETKSELVSNQSLAAAARALSLDEGIRVGRGRNAGEEVRSSDRILANVFEAVLGAAYLDGGMPAARGVLGAAFRKKLQRLRLTAPEGVSGWLDRARQRIALHRPARHPVRPPSSPASQAGRTSARIHVRRSGHPDRGTRRGRRGPGTRLREPPGQDAANQWAPAPGPPIPRRPREPPNW